MQASNSLEREKYRRDAKEILQKQLQYVQDAYPFSGLGDVFLDELRDKLREPPADGQEPTEDRLKVRVVTDLIGQAEEVISRGLQNFPGDEYLLTLQASLSNILQNEPRAMQALETAFKTNPRSDVVATRLAYHYLRSDKRQEAEDTLKKCLEQNPGSKRVHLELARIFLDSDAKTYKDTISYHLKRSFTEGDTNYHAQILYGRHEFLYGDKREAERIFRNLSNQTFAPQFRNRRWGEVRNAAGTLVEYGGQVNKRDDSFCFVSIAALGTSVFVHFSQFSGAEWDSLMLNTSIRCNIDFTVRGPCGVNAKIVR